MVGNAGEEDEGEYECRVEAPDGQIASCFTDVYFVQDEHGELRDIENPLVGNQLALL